MEDGKGCNGWKSHVLVVRSSAGFRPVPDFAEPSGHVDLVAHDIDYPRMFQHLTGIWSHTRVARKAVNKLSLSNEHRNRTTYANLMNSFISGLYVIPSSSSSSGGWDRWLSVNSRTTSNHTYFVLGDKHH